MDYRGAVILSDFFLQLGLGNYMPITIALYSLIAPSIALLWLVGLMV